MVALTWLRGQRAEADAADHLRRAGLSILDRNARTRGGEIDVVALEGDVLVMVEVRARASSRYGSAAETVDRRKQLRVIQAAQVWLQRHPEHAHRPVRFDVMAYDGVDATPQWLRHAFEASS